MSAFSIVPRQTRQLAVRSWPGNEETIENLFGDRVVKSEDPDYYDWKIPSQGGYEFDVVQRGDWLVLTERGRVVKYTHEKFEAEFVIMESAFDLEDPTGKKDQA